MSAQPPIVPPAHDDRAAAERDAKEAIRHLIGRCPKCNSGTCWHADALRMALYALHDLEQPLPESAEPVYDDREFPF